MNESSGFEASLEPSISSSASLNSTIWLLAEDVSGPAIAAVVCIEFLLGFPSNLFIIIHTLHYGKECMNEPSTFLFFILALSNLLVILLYWPFWIVASAAEEWLFGNTDYTRDILCQIHGFVVVYLIVASIHTLAVISVDRFLNIVKPQIHKKYMTWKVSLGIMAILWIIDVFVSVSPYYDPTFGEYGWSRSIGACVPIFVDHELYVVLQALHSLIPLSIIAITSTWTFAFTRGFLKMNLKRQKTMLSTASFVEQKHIYSVQVKNLIGIFGSLFLFSVLSWIPFLLISAVGLGIGFQNIPDPVYAGGYILFHFSNVSNPIIQTYFRKDLTDSLKAILCMCKYAHKVSSGMAISIGRRKRIVNTSGTSEINHSREETELKNVKVQKEPMASECNNSMETLLTVVTEDCSSTTGGTVKQVENSPQENLECSNADHVTHGCNEVNRNSIVITYSPISTVEA